MEQVLDEDAVTMFRPERAVRFIELQHFPFPVPFTADDVRSELMEELAAEEVAAMATAGLREEL